MVYDTFPEKVDVPRLMSLRLSAHTRNISRDIVDGKVERFDFRSTGTVRENVGREKG